MWYILLLLYKITYNIVYIMLAACCTRKECNVIVWFNWGMALDKTVPSHLSLPSPLFSFPKSLQKNC